MLASVRKSICLARMAVAISLSIGATLVYGAAVAESGGKSATTNTKQPVQQIKTLDDNKEVLRPIPTVIKGRSTGAPADSGADIRSKASEAVKGKGGEKTSPKQEEVVAGKSTTPGKGTAAKEAGAAKTDAAAKGGADTSTSAKGEAPKGKEGAETSKKKVAKTRTPSAPRGSHFVPPPPPVVPTMLGGDFGVYSGLPIEMLSRDALKDRVKEISMQYKDACRELEDHTSQKNEKIARAQEFEGLYKEGVVSRRELEASQKEASEVNSDIDRLTFKVSELKGLLERINKRLTPTVVKKNGHKLIN